MADVRTTAIRIFTGLVHQKDQQSPVIQEAQPVHREDLAGEETWES